MHVCLKSQDPSSGRDRASELNLISGEARRASGLSVAKEVYDLGMPIENLRGLCFLYYRWVNLTYEGDFRSWEQCRSINRSAWWVLTYGSTSINDVEALQHIYS